MNADNSSRPPHRDWHGTHHSWSYRPEAFRWQGPQIVGINFIPIAREVRAWLMNRGKLPIASLADQREPGAYTNPYTYSASALSLILGRVINAFHD